jgi:hypothetical protein
MSIPETQLDTWSGQGSIIQSSTTYATIRGVLETGDSPYAGMSFVSYLQGSYGNDTNIYADSDVDIVMKLDAIFYTDLTDLTEDEKVLYNAQKSSATYSYFDFKRDVLTHLTSKFGVSVKSGSKAILISGNGNRRDADVVVCADYRRYTRFRGAHDNYYVDGVTFWSADRTQIINYPKLHSKNCTAKHQGTNQYFKPTVRIFKNMRNRMIDGNYIREGLAPSYFIEGMLYNVPSEHFGSSYGDTFAAAMNWLLAADRSKLVCANEQFFLLHPTSPVTWRADECSAFLDALVKFWNDWGA